MDLRKACDFYRIILNEVRKEFLLIWSHRIQWVCEIFCLILFFFFLTRINPYHQNSDKDFFLELYLVNYAIWFYAVLIIGDVGGKLANEMRTGTFEQICLAVIPMIWILIARIFASIVRATMLFFLLIIPLALLFSIQISFQHANLFFRIFFCLIPGLFGLSFCLGGITLLTKEMGSIFNAINNTLLFLSGSFVSLDSFPGWIASFAKCLPTTQAISIFRNQVQNTRTLPSSGLNGEIWNLIGTSLLYLVIGLLIFFLCEKKAKLLGTLGHY